MKAPSQQTVAMQDVMILRTALSLYVEDEKDPPGLEMHSDASRNDFPLLFNALFGERRPTGPGGRCAPYARISVERIAVLDRQKHSYQRASQVEIHDPKTPKFFLDPWGRPYVYRAREAVEGQLGTIYSFGANGVDDTMTGKRCDDING